MDEIINKLMVQRAQRRVADEARAKHKKITAAEHFFERVSPAKIMKKFFFFSNGKNLKFIYLN